MTPLQRAILNQIQAAFPLVSAPYAELAGMLEATPDAVRAAIATCRTDGIIRRIGGSFEAARLGYVSALVAAKVDPPQLEQAANSAAQFDEVTHDYERNAAHNLWFTVVAESADRLDTITTTIAACSGVCDLHVLPALRTFKLRVNFDVRNSAPPMWSAASLPPEADRARMPAPTSRRPYCETRSLSTGASPEKDPVVHAYSADLDDSDRRLIARCCHDVGDGDRPFEDMASDVGLAESEALDRLLRYRTEGIMRRFGAMIRHQQAGFTANAMGVWDVPAEDVGHVGKLLAGCDAVSHCYERPRFAEWPFNLYSMIHGRSEDECRRTAAELKEQTGVTSNRLLFTGREFKKTSVRYFTRYWSPDERPDSVIPRT